MSVIVHKTSDFAVMQDGDHLSILEFSGKRMAVLLIATGNGLMFEFTDRVLHKIRCPLVVADLGESLDRALVEKANDFLSAKIETDQLVFLGCFEPKPDILQTQISVYFVDAREKFGATNDKYTVYMPFGFLPKIGDALTCGLSLSAIMMAIARGKLDIESSDFVPNLFS